MIINADRARGLILTGFGRLVGETTTEEGRSYWIIDDTWRKVTCHFQTGVDADIDVYLDNVSCEENATN